MRQMVRFRMERGPVHQRWRQLIRCLNPNWGSSKRSHQPVALLVWLLLAISLCRPAFCLPSTPKAGAVATVIDVRGPVQVIRASSGQPIVATIGLWLYENDKVIAGREGAGRILHESGELIPLAHDQTIEIRQATKKGPPSLFTRISQTIQEMFALTSDSLHQSGMARLTDTGMTLISPRGIKLLSTRPTFRWEPSNANTVYIMELAEENSRRLLYMAQVAGGIAEYPSSAPPLAPGIRYRWSLTPRDATEPTGAVTFEILSDEDRHSVEERLTTLRQVIQANTTSLISYILSGALFQDKTLYTDAALVLSDPTTLSPNNPRIDLILTRLYQTVGLSDQVNSGK